MRAGFVCKPVSVVKSERAASVAFVNWISTGLGSEMVGWQSARKIKSVLRGLKLSSSNSHY